MNSTHIQLNNAFVEKLPKRGIMSQTLFKNDSTSLVFMQLAAGEDLSEHTSKFPAVIHVLNGSGKIGLPNETIEAEPGTWVYMDAEMEHNVEATTDMTFILYLFKYNTKE